MSHIRSVHWGVPVRETLVLSHRLCEVGWPVPFLAALIDMFMCTKNEQIMRRWITKLKNLCLLVIVIADSDC